MSPLISSDPNPFAISLIASKRLFAICKLPSATQIPDWAYSESFFSITKTKEELSIVCSLEQVPQGVIAETKFCILQVAGILDFSLVGILATLTTILAKQHISLFSVSTYNTDYLLIREDKLDAAILALRNAGHIVTWE